jgi:hypothetical protein
MKVSMVSLEWSVAAIAILATLLVALLAIKQRPKGPHGETPTQARERARRVEDIRIVLFLFGIVVVVLIAVFASAGGSEWGIPLALLPFIMIVQHAMFLRIVRRPVLVPLKKHSDSQGKPDSQGDPDWWRCTLAAAKQATERYFGAGSLAIRYGASALAVLMISLAVFLIFFARSDLPSGFPEHLRHPAMMGAAGAYVYVLLHLGYRNFTHDVTSGGAMWCSITLAAGPLLACAISYFLGPTLEGTNLGADAIYFMAGLSPRYVTSKVEALVRKSWLSSPSTGAPAPRTIPLTQVKGITPEIAERLVEEGIADVHGLAMADPLRLIRNTNFDKRLIVSWIDEALLITTLRERWSDMEARGITGAVSFVSLVYPPPYLKAADQKHEYPQDVKDAHLQLLCQPQAVVKDEHGEHPATNGDDAKMLRSVAAQLWDDAQLRLIWVLHDHISDETVADEVAPGPEGLAANPRGE